MNTHLLALLLFGSGLLAAEETPPAEPVPIEDDSPAVPQRTTYIPSELTVQPFVPPPPRVAKPLPVCRIDASVTHRTKDGTTLTLQLGEPSTAPDLPEPPPPPPPVVRRDPTPEEIAQRIHHLRHSLNLGATIYDHRVSVVNWTDPETRVSYEAVCGYDIGLLAGTGGFVHEGEDYQFVLIHSHISTEGLREVFRGWRCGTMDITSGDKNLDTHAVEVLARRRVSNYFSPTWGGTWGGNSLQKGVYPAGQFPAGLHNVARQTGFLDALDPLNEGLAMDGNTVIRDQVQPAQQGFNRVLYLNGAEHGYIESSDRDQDNASSPNVTLLRAISVAVRTNADRLAYDDEVYIPQFSVRTVDDSGTLDGNTDQIDVWRGQGDQTLQDTVDNFGLRRRTCLKIIPAPES